MRRIIKYVHDRDDRDKGNVYIIEEMPASKAERWANRYILGIGRTGLDVGPVAGLGVAGVALLGFAKMVMIDEPLGLELADELMSCVKIKTEAAPQGRTLVETDTWEVTTRWILKMEAFILHTGFSKTEVKTAWTSVLGLAASAIIRREDSREQSPPSSVPEKPASSNSKRSSGSKTRTISSTSSSRTRTTGKSTRTRRGGTEA